MSLVRLSICCVVYCRQRGRMYVYIGRRSLRACVRTEFGSPIRGRKVISHSQTLNTRSAIMTAGLRDIHWRNDVKENFGIIAPATCFISLTNCPRPVPNRLISALYLRCYCYVTGSMCIKWE